MRRYILFFLWVLLFGGCQDNSQQNSQNDSKYENTLVHPSTQQMVDSIKAIYNRTDFRNHPYEFAERLVKIEEEIKSLQGQLMSDQVFEYARAQLNAGHPDKAVGTLQKLIKLKYETDDVTEENKNYYEMLAISFLRYGEQKNCIENHSEESCILPIMGKGIHVDTEGSSNAIIIYEKILSYFPEDMQSRWLLNIAYMTLGKYPDEVPKEYLVPDMDKKAPVDFPHFNNRAVDLGLDWDELAGGVIAEDFDNDGFIDLMASSWGMLDQLRFFKNNGDGTFSDETKTSGLVGITGGLNMTQGDFNNDGFVDLVVLRGGWKYDQSWGILPNSLIQNNGDGTFTDVTIGAGMYSTRPCKTAVWADFNTDGWLDLFVGNESIEGKSQFPCQLYANNGDGTFTDVAPQIDMDILAYAKGVSSGDINNDGLPDLYISCLTSDNLLYVNRGGVDWKDWRFEEIGGKAGVEKPFHSFPSWFYDFNNDGWEDIFVFPFGVYAYNNQGGETALDYMGLPFESLVPAVYQNNGDEAFSNVTKKLGLNKVLHTMGCNYGDLDNDGYLDFYLGTGAPDYRAIVPNRMFRNLSGTHFEDVTLAGGFGHLQKGHGVAFADFDNDGDQDIYSVMGGSYTGDNAQNTLFENPGNENNWLQIQLQGTKTNRSAIGSKIIVTVTSSNGKQRKIYNTVSGGASFGCNSLRQEIGLGDATGIEQLEVIWANGSNEAVAYGAVEMNQCIKIVEGELNIVAIELLKVNFQQVKNAHHHH